MCRKISFSPEIVLSSVFIILTLCFSSGAAKGVAEAINALTPHTDKENVPVISEEYSKEEIVSDKTGVEEDTESEPGYVTPEDILEYEREYLDEYSGKTAAGMVTEKFFVTDAATFISGNVAIRNCTEQSPDFETIICEGVELGTEDSSQPAVLIFHTHTTEAYLPSFNGSYYEGFKTRSLDPLKSVVRVGEAICSALEEKGVKCIHDVNVYDSAYNGAYSRSREGILKLLEEYPSIKIVLDIHRDAVYSSGAVAIKPTAVINGKKAAQIMIITGAEEGRITDFPDWKKNLSFALCLQKAVQDKYEGLMKPIYFCERKYNMDVSPCSLLLEFGSDTNTLEEAVYSGALFGDALADMINGS